MEKQEKIDWSQLTPEAAYSRIIAFAIKLSLNYEKPSYHKHTTFKFIWDKNSTYTYRGATIHKKHVFERDSDGKIFILSPYAFLPQDQPIIIN